MADRNQGRANRSDDKMSASEAGRKGAANQSPKDKAKGGKHSGETRRRST